MKNSLAFLKSIRAWLFQRLFGHWELIAISLMVAVLPGCSGSESKVSQRHFSATPERGATVAILPPRLTFRAQELAFQYDRGETGDFWPVEVTGGGVGLLDYDGDGDLDLFFCQGGPLKRSSNLTSHDVLLRNEGGRRFVDVSDQVGLVAKGYGQGVTVADYDGDGDPDVFVTRYKANTLWRNDAGKFIDVSKSAGVVSGSWSLGAAFFDMDGDDDLDLFVANYFDFDPLKAPYARDSRGNPRYGSPQNFPGEPDALYRNNGDGTFTDVTVKAGIAEASRGMGCLATDFDGDGHMDILVANDAMANALWRNRGDGTFEDVASAWGLALNGDGLAEANMGIGYSDVDGDGLPDVAITHFVDERTTLWRRLADDKNVPGARFFDISSSAGLISASRPVTGWGIAFADFDQDGWMDLIQTNGHLLNESDRTFPYRNPPTLWRNQGEGRFRDVTADAGPYFREVHQGRGLAVGDLDGDGDLDVVVVHHHAPSVILWNETELQGGRLTIRLNRDGANRNAIGANVTAFVGPKSIVRTLDGGGGYLSSNSPIIHFGLGAAKQAHRVEVRWPSGRVEVRSGVPTGSMIEWLEGSEPSLPDGWIGKVSK